MVDVRRWLLWVEGEREATESKLVLCELAGRGYTAIGTVNSAAEFAV
jgi:hypothetical protein